MPTVEDIRIDEIGKIILDHRYEKDPRDMDALKYSSYLIAKKVLEYLASDLEKAHCWDRVKKIAGFSELPLSYCDKCPCLAQCENTLGEYLCVSAKTIVDALENEKEAENDKS